MRRVLRLLDRHFFAPASLRDLAVVRATLAATQLLYLFFGADLVRGEFGGTLRWQQQLTNAVAGTFVPLPVLKLLLLPLGWGARPTPAFVEVVWLIAVVSAVAVIVGVFTRVSGFLLALTSTLIIAHAYSYGEIHHPEGLLIIMLWVLALAPVGPWSLGRQLMRRLTDRPAGALATHAADDLSPLARWPLRVGQWLLVLSYFSAALSKAQNGGPDWVNGYTLTYYMLQDGMRYDTALGLWFASRPGLALVLSVGALLFEATFVVAILVPRTAWIYVLSGIAMHTTIYVTQRAPFFMFMAMYVVFLEPLRDSWLALRGRLSAPARRVAAAPQG